MARRSPTRWLAPAAILAVAAAAYVVATSSKDSTDSGGSPAPSSGGKPAATTTRTTVSTPTSTTTRKTYVVRSGDTLSAISIETGVPVERLTQLNPDLDAQALQPGQRLKLQ